MDYPSPFDSLQICHNSRFQTITVCWKNSWLDFALVLIEFGRFWLKFCQNA